MCSSDLLEGQQVLPKHLQAENFAYQYPTVEQAMQAVVAAT